MLTISTVFISLVVLNALLASTGQGQVEANVLRRAIEGHTARQSHAIRELLNVPGRDESFQRRQYSCTVGFFACSDGTGCCPTGQTCETLNGTPGCCCNTSGNCPTGELPCSGNASVCCPNGDLCSSDGTCSSGGAGGGGSGGSGSGVKKNGESGLRARTAVVMMGSVIVASGLMVLNL